MRLKIQSSRQLWTVSLIIFVAVAVAMLFSTYYMNISIRAEEEAQTKRAEYKQLGEDLASASDYLTAEVRSYAITGDIEHLYNYWNEIHVTRRREHVIEVFEQTNQPDDEKQMLHQAKMYSDLLVETETYSMKLALTAREKTAGDYRYNEALYQYVQYVLSYESDDKNMTQMSFYEMKDKAIEILYDDNYENYKTLIMTPIDEFTRHMNARLDQEVEERKLATRIATAVQIAMALASLFAVGYLLNMMNKLYVKPLESYTQDIDNAREYADMGTSQELPNVSILSAKIVPMGALELVRFAETFNRLIDMFFQELRERINAQESMRKARNEAELANQAKSLFLAHMSHELRTPLNAVNGYTYLLEQTDLVRKQQEYVKGIRYSATGLLELINQILDFSKIEAGHLELEKTTFSIRGLIQEVEAVFAQQAAQKGIHFEVVVQEAVPDYLEGDPLRLRQVLVNLLGNAFKFTVEGSVALRICMLRKRDGICLLYFSVSDTGIGIQEEVMDRIFQPFMQSDASVTRKYGGTGLGLPICKEIIAMAGDGSHSLQVTSDVGVGSTFYFDMDFPYHSKVAAEKETDESSRDMIPQFPDKKILLTDDSEINIRVQSEILSLCGVMVYKAQSGEEAIRIVTQVSDIDLIFMDIRMPELDGYETAGRIRSIEAYQKCPIIALTADAVPEVQRKIKDAGMNDCMLKPIDQNELFGLLIKYLSGAGEKIVVKRASHIRSKESGHDNIFNEELCLQQIPDRTVIGEIIDSFLMMHSDDDRILGELLAQKDYAAARELVHRLKGIAGNLNCEELYRCCAALWDNMEDAATYDEFQHIWEQTIAVLQKRQLAYGKIREQEPVSNCVPDRNVCRQILELCDDCDTEAVHLTEQIVDSLKRRLSDEDAAELEKAMLMYDFETIKKCVGHCVGKVRA